TTLRESLARGYWRTPPPLHQPAHREHRSRDLIDYPGSLDHLKRILLFIYEDASPASIARLGAFLADEDPRVRDFVGLILSQAPIARAVLPELRPSFSPADDDFALVLTRIFAALVPSSTAVLVSLLNSPPASRLARLGAFLADEDPRVRDLAGL